MSEPDCEATFGGKKLLLEKTFRGKLFELCTLASNEQEKEMSALKIAADTLNARETAMQHREKVHQEEVAAFEIHLKNSGIEQTQQLAAARLQQIDVLKRNQEQLKKQKEDAQKLQKEAETKLKTVEAAYRTTLQEKANLQDAFDKIQLELTNALESIHDSEADAMSRSQ